MAPKESRRFLFTLQEPEEQVAEIDIKDGDSMISIVNQLRAAFPTLKEGDKYVKGFYEGSPSGVYKPFHRVRWMNTPAMTQFYLDVAIGEDAKKLKQNKEERDKEKEQKESSSVKILRRRWGQGYRKCARCQAMYLVQQNTDDACKFVDEGFSPEEGSYRKLSVAKHVQAKPLLDEYNEYVKDITTVGGVNKTLLIGTVGVGLTTHAKEGGSIGSAGENLNGWKPSDFGELTDKQKAEGDKIEKEAQAAESSGCYLM